MDGDGGISLRTGQYASYVYRIESEARSCFGEWIVSSCTSCKPDAWRCSSLTMADRSQKAVKL